MVTQDMNAQNMNVMPMGERLVAAGLLSERDLERARLAKREMGCMLGEALVRLGLVAEANVVKYLGEELDIPIAEKACYPDEPVVIEGLREHFLLNNNVVPLASTEGRITLAALKPQDDFVRKALHLATGKQIELQLGVAADIEAALKLYFQSDEEDEVDSLSTFDVNDAEFVEHLKDLASETPVIQLVNQLIQRSMDLGASDIHVESVDGGLRLRYRIDGVLQDAPAQIDERLAAAVISRVKLLANLNIAERRLPQDGRIMMRVKGHELDLRVSSLPTVHGECVVMRVLDRQSVRLDIADMGFSPNVLKHYLGLLSRPGITADGSTGPVKPRRCPSPPNLSVTVEDPVLQLGSTRYPCSPRLAGVCRAPFRPRQDPGTS